MSGRTFVGQLLPGKRLLHTQNNARKLLPAIHCSIKTTGFGWPMIRCSSKYFFLGGPRGFLPSCCPRSHHPLLLQPVISRRLHHHYDHSVVLLYCLRTTSSPLLLPTTTTTTKYHGCACPRRALSTHRLQRKVKLPSQ